MTVFHEGAILFADFCRVARDSARLGGQADELGAACHQIIPKLIELCGGGGN